MKQKLKSDETIKSYSKTIRITKNTVLKSDGYSNIRFRNYGTVDAKVEEIPLLQNDGWLPFENKLREQWIGDWKIEFDAVGGVMLIIAQVTYFDINPKTT